MILTLWLVKWLTNQGYVTLIYPGTVDKHSHPTKDQKVQLSLFFTHFLFFLVPHLNQGTNSDSLLVQSHVPSFKMYTNTSILIKPRQHKSIWLHYKLK